MNTPPLDLQSIWDRHSDGDANEYLKFERVKDKLSNRPDLHAFILLDKLCPDNCDIVSCAAHDEFWVSVTPEDLAKVATEEQIIDLIRCGLRYDSSGYAFTMFS